MGILDKFKIGLGKSSKSFSDGFKNIVINRKVDSKTLNNLEDFLIKSDVGVIAAKELKQIFSDTKVDPKKDNLSQIILIVQNYIKNLMSPLEKNIVIEENIRPKVILVAGVNGVGKTTTIGKLGKIFSKNNKQIVFAAGDTFRAAAIEQLEIWSERIGAKIIKSEIGSDPASVAFKAIEYSQKNNMDCLLIDTAGRLQNKKNLMDEFKKISKVLKKVDPSSPHETLLILDATTGQNSLSQVEEFQKITPISGLIMTKLDGTAKGGILLAVAKKYNLPIVAIGLGEKEEDLELFKAENYAKALMQH
jgi:fused signal recognition particle receptor